MINKYDFLSNIVKEDYIKQLIIDENISKDKIILYISFFEEIEIQSNNKEYRKIISYIRELNDEENINNNILNINFAKDFKKIFDYLINKKDFENKEINLKIEYIVLKKIFSINTQFNIKKIIGSNELLISYDLDKVNFDHLEKLYLNIIPFNLIEKKITELYNNIDDNNIINEIKNYINFIKNKISENPFIEENFTKLIYLYFLKEYLYNSNNNLIKKKVFDLIKNKIEEIDKEYTNFNKILFNKILAIKNNDFLYDLYFISNIKNVENNNELYIKIYSDKNFLEEELDILLIPVDIFDLLSDAISYNFKVNIGNILKFNNEIKEIIGKNEDFEFNLEYDDNNINKNLIYIPTNIEYINKNTFTFNQVQVYKNYYDIIYNNNVINDYNIQSDIDIIKNKIGFYNIKNIISYINYHLFDDNKILELLTFSSLQKRLHNAIKKIELIQYYNNLINNSSQNIILYNKYIAEKNKILENLDLFEKYFIYNENIIDDYIDILLDENISDEEKINIAKLSFPKKLLQIENDNDINKSIINRKYDLLDITNDDDRQKINIWLKYILLKAKHIDDLNYNRIINSVPEKIRYDINNLYLIELLEYFAIIIDEIIYAISNISKIYIFNEKNTNIDINILIKAFGLDNIITDNALIKNLYDYFYNKKSQNNDIFLESVKNIKDEINRRLISNLNLILSSKGTKKCIDYLLNILNINFDFLDLIEIKKIKKIDLTKIEKQYNKRILLNYSYNNLNNYDSYILINYDYLYDKDNENYQIFQNEITNLLNNNDYFTFIISFRLDIDSIENKLNELNDSFNSLLFSIDSGLSSKDRFDVVLNFEKILGEYGDEIYMYIDFLEYKQVNFWPPIATLYRAYYGNQYNNYIKILSNENNQKIKNQDIIIKIKFTHYKENYEYGINEIKTDIISYDYKNKNNIITINGNNIDIYGYTTIPNIFLLSQYNDDIVKKIIIGGRYNSNEKFFNFYQLEYFKVLKDDYSFNEFYQDIINNKIYNKKLNKLIIDIYYKNKLSFVNNPSIYKNNKDNLYNSIFDDILIEYYNFKNINSFIEIQDIFNENILQLPSNINYNFFENKNINIYKNNNLIPIKINNKQLYTLTNKNEYNLSSLNKIIFGLNLSKIINNNILNIINENPTKIYFLSKLEREKLFLSKFNELLANNLSINNYIKLFDSIFEPNLFKILYKFVPSRSQFYTGISIANPIFPTGEEELVKDIDITNEYKECKINNVYKTLNVDLNLNIYNAEINNKCKLKEINSDYLLINADYNIKNYIQLNSKIKFENLNINSNIKYKFNDKNILYDAIINPINPLTDIYYQYFTSISNEFDIDGEIFNNIMYKNFMYFNYYNHKQLFNNFINSKLYYNFIKIYNYNIDDILITVTFVNLINNILEYIAYNNLPYHLSKFFENIVNYINNQCQYKYSTYIIMFIDYISELRSIYNSEEWGEYYNIDLSNLSQLLNGLIVSKLDKNITPDNEFNNYINLMSNLINKIVEFEYDNKLYKNYIKINPGFYNFRHIKFQRKSLGPLYNSFYTGSKLLSDNNKTIYKKYIINNKEITIPYKIFDSNNEPIIEIIVYTTDDLLKEQESRYYIFDGNSFVPIDNEYIGKSNIVKPSNDKNISSINVELTE